MEELAVAAHAAAPPDADAGLAGEFAGRQLDHRRPDIGLGVRIDAGPRRLSAEMGHREVPAAARIEQVLDSVKVEEEGIAAAAGEEGVVAGPDNVGRGAEGDLGIGDDLSA